MLHGKSVIALSKASVTEALQDFLQKHLATNCNVTVEAWMSEGYDAGIKVTFVQAEAQLTNKA